MARSRVSARTREQIRNEYNRITKEINKNLAEIEKKRPDSIALERYRGYFEPIEETDLNYNTMRRMLKQARQVYESGETSLDVIERGEALAIKTLKEEGYDFINRRNFNSFMRFLDDARARGLGSLYSSEQLLEMIHEAKKRGLSKREILKNMDRWAKQTAKRDKEGKIVEQVKPKKLTIRRYKK